MSLSVSNHGRIDLWTLGPVDPWTHGPIDPWPRGLEMLHLMQMLDTCINLLMQKYRLSLREQLYIPSTQF